MSLNPALRKSAELGIALTAIATLILAGCGGGSSTATGSNTVVSTTTSVTPFKGRFTSGTVSLKDANGQNVTLTSGGSINASGVASVSFPSTVTYPLTVNVSGTYIDETTGLSADMPAGTPLQGMIPAASDATAASGIPVTAVTHFARNMLPTSGVSAASAVAAIAGAASSVLGVGYDQAMLPPVFDANGLTTDPNTIKLAALAHVIGQQGAGNNLAEKLNDVAAQLAASGVTVNTVLPQADLNNALAALNQIGGASGVLPTGAPTPTIPNFNPPNAGLGNQINAGIPICNSGEMLHPTPNGLLCVGTGSGGGGSTSLSCNTSLFSGGVRDATAGELSSYAQTYSGQSGTFDQNFNFVANGSATLVFNASGVLTHNTQAQTVTSICYETAVPQLVVHFGAMGHVDFKTDGTFNGYDGSNVIRKVAAGGGSGATNKSLAAQAGGFSLPATAASLAGTYDVVIYTALPESGQAASSVTGYLGLAKLEVRNTSGSYYALELKTPGGALISRNTNDSNLSMAAFMGFQLSSNASSATIGGTNGTAIATSVTASFNADGTITGNALGNYGIGMITFRNNITHFGPNVPPAFTALAGNWAGQAQALTCGQPQVTLSILADSNITLNGQPNLNCVQTSYSTSWDGNDDYLIPNASGGFKLVINANQYAATVDNGVITGPGPGALTLVINDALTPTAISDAQLLYGSGGNIQSVSLTKQ